MKKLMIVALCALSLCTANVWAMQEPFLLERTFKDFTVKACDLSQDKREGALKQLDAQLNLIYPDRSRPRYRLSEIIEGVLGKKLSVATIGANSYGDAILVNLNNTYVTDDGEVDCYDAAHMIYANRRILRTLLADDSKSFKITQNSGLGLSWLLPTVKYGGTFLLGVTALKLYQMYKAR